MDAKEWTEFKKAIEDWMAKQGEKDSVIKEISDKIKKLEENYLALLPSAMGKSVPIIPGVFWRDEKQASDWVTMLKHVYRKENEIVKTMTEGTDSEGGFLVPTEFRATLIRLIEAFGLVRRKATVIPMTREEMHIPKLASGITVYWPGEAGSITPSQPVFDRVTLTAKKMAALVPVSGELLEDSAIPIANLLITLFAESMAQEEDRVGLLGNTGGGDPFMGVINDASIGNLVMGAGDVGFDNLTADYLLDMTAQVATSALNGSGYMLNRTVLDKVRKLKDTSDNYIFQAPTASAPGTIWGYPYDLTDTMPSMAASAVSTPFVIFGNMRHFYFGDRRQVTIAQSIHLGFAEDLTYLRATERMAQSVAIGTAFVKLTTAAA